MKKIFLFLFILIASAAANAQAYIGGTFGLGVESVSTDGDTETGVALALAPEAGYYFNKTWALGASVGVQYSKVADIGVTTFSILPYVRATFARAGAFDFFAELAMGYAHQKVEDFDGVGGFIAGFRPGFAAHLGEKFSLIGRTTLLQYTHYDGISDFGFAINSNVELGVQFTF